MLAPAIPAPIIITFFSELRFRGAAEIVLYRAVSISLFLPKPFFFSILNPAFVSPSFTNAATEKLEIVAF